MLTEHIVVRLCTKRGDGATTDLLVENKVMAVQCIFRLAQTRLNLHCHGNAMTDSCQLGGIRGRV